MRPYSLALWLAGLVALVVLVGLVAGGPDSLAQLWHRARLTLGRVETVQERELLSLPETPGWDRGRIIEEFVWAERYFEQTFFTASRADPQALPWIMGRFLNPAQDQRLDRFDTWVTPQKMAMLAVDQARSDAGLRPEDVGPKLTALGYSEREVRLFTAIYATYLARADSSPAPGEPLSALVSRYLTGR